MRSIWFIVSVSALIGTDVSDTGAGASAHPVKKQAVSPTQMALLKLTRKGRLSEMPWEITELLRYCRRCPEFALQMETGPWTERRQGKTVVVLVEGAATEPLPHETLRGCYLIAQAWADKFGDTVNLAVSAWGPNGGLHPGVGTFHPVAQLRRGQRLRLPRPPKNLVQFRPGRRGCKPVLLPVTLGTPPNCAYCQDRMIAATSFAVEISYRGYRQYVPVCETHADTKWPDALSLLPRRPGLTFE